MPPQPQPPAPQAQPRLMQDHDARPPHSPVPSAARLHGTQPRPDEMYTVHREMLRHVPALRLYSFPDGRFLLRHIPLSYETLSPPDRRAPSGNDAHGLEQGPAQRPGEWREGKGRVVGEGKGHRMVPLGSRGPRNARTAVVNVLSGYFDTDACDNRHAGVWVKEDDEGRTRFFIRDIGDDMGPGGVPLGSLRGTFVNGVRLPEPPFPHAGEKVRRAMVLARSGELRTGDIVQLGSDILDADDVAPATYVNNPSKYSCVLAYVVCAASEADLNPDPAVFMRRRSLAANIATSLIKRREKFVRSGNKNLSIPLPFGHEQFLPGTTERLELRHGIPSPLASGSPGSPEEESEERDPMKRVRTSGPYAELLKRFYAESRTARPVSPALDDLKTRLARSGPSPLLRTQDLPMSLRPQGKRRAPQRSPLREVTSNEENVHAPAVVWPQANQRSESRQGGGAPSGGEETTDDEGVQTRRPRARLRKRRRLQSFPIDEQKNGEPSKRASTPPPKRARSQTPPPTRPRTDSFTKRLGSFFPRCLARLRGYASEGEDPDDDNDGPLFDPRNRQVDPVTGQVSVVSDAFSGFRSKRKEEETLPWRPNREASSRYPGFTRPTARPNPIDRPRPTGIAADWTPMLGNYNFEAQHKNADPSGPVPRGSRRHSGGGSAPPSAHANAALFGASPPPTPTGRRSRLPPASASAPVPPPKSAVSGVEADGSGILRPRSVLGRSGELLIAPKPKPAGPRRHVRFRPSSSNANSLHLNTVSSYASSDRTLVVAQRPPAIRGHARTVSAPTATSTPAWQIWGDAFASKSAPRTRR